MELHLETLIRIGEIKQESKTYSGGCVHSQHTFRLVKCKETRLTNFILVEKLRVRLILDGSIYSA
jgi:hypothetical protein